MHRHGYKGRKFHRETDQRRALMKGLSESLIKYESIETTLPKAKEVLIYVEKLITKAKKGDLANRRTLISRLQTINSAHKLMDELAPKLMSRNSGHLRIEKTTLRRGDNAQMARISFIFDEVKTKQVQPEMSTDNVKSEAEKIKSKTTKPKQLKKPNSTQKTTKKEGVKK